MFQQHPWVLRALVVQREEPCAQSRDVPRAWPTSPPSRASVGHEPTDHPSDHRPSERTITMHSFNTSLVETLVKDRQRDLHRVAGHSRQRRDAERRRERQRQRR